MNKAVLAIFVLAIVACVYGQAARYPAGVHPASCPNYPFCNTNGLAYSPPGYHFDRSLGYPAGIHPSTCPNYPYC